MTDVQRHCVHSRGVHFNHVGARPPRAAIPPLLTAPIGGFPRFKRTPKPVRRIRRPQMSAEAMDRYLASTDTTWYSAVDDAMWYSSTIDSRTLMTSTTNSATTTWTQWADQTATTSTAFTTTSSAIGNRAWGRWITTTESLQLNLYTADQMTPERQQMLDDYRREREAERQREHERYHAQYAQLQSERDAANKRAEQLLIENLSLRQREEYQRHGYFVVFGRNRMRYRIRKGLTGNVDVVNPAGDVIHRLCAHIRDEVPVADNMLAQKLMLEFDDEDFQRRANIHSLLATANGVLPPLQ